MLVSEFERHFSRNRFVSLLFGAWILANPPFATAEVSPGVEFDLQDYIDQAVANGATLIKIPEGRHRVDPASNGSHLSLVGLSNITIDGTGAEMICTHTTRSISIENCTNLTIIGLTIDYDPLPFTQGRITEMSEDKRTMHIQLMDGYPGSGSLKGDKLEIFDSITEELVTNTYYGVKFETDGPRAIIVVKPSNYRAENSHEKVGDIAVIGSGVPGKTVPHGILSTGCKGLVMQDVTLYASNSFGFFETDCRSSRYIGCVVDRRPLKDDLKRRDHRRMRSLTADAFHSKHAIEGPSYVGCIARYMGDDGIAINGHYHIITGFEGSRLRVVGKFGDVPNLSVGDPVELVSYTGERVENAVITAFQPGPALNETEKQFLEAQTFHGNVQTTRNAEIVYYVTLDRAIDLPMGSLIASANRIGNGFEVRNCTIGPNRSRGILVKASDGIISGNRLVLNWGQAIKLAPEYSWLEAGSGSNVTISDNTITGCNDAAIAVYAYGGNGLAAPAGAHSDITIVGNTIRYSTNPAIAVTSVRGLKLYGNTIESPNNDGLAPWVMGSFGRMDDPSRQVYIENVEDIQGAPSTRLEQWRDRYHIAQDGSEDLADFAGDGIPALLKLAFNLGNPREESGDFRKLDLNAPQNGGFPALRGGKDFYYHYVQLEGDNAGVDYLCEYTVGSPMNNWGKITENHLLFDSISNVPIGDAGYELVSVSLNKYLVDDNFFRVRISRP